MTEPGGPAVTIRVGVRFEKVSSAVQTELDRLVFALINRKARARGPQDERRLAPRVEVVSERFAVELLPDLLRGALSGGRSAATQRFKMFDLSTTGCSFFCEPGQLQPRQLLRLRLVGQGLDVELQARVIHACCATGG